MLSPLPIASLQGRSRAPTWISGAGRYLLLLLCLQGCDTSSPLPRQLAHFGFEESGWTAKAKRTQEAAHSGHWAGMLDVGTHSGRTFSPLIACVPGETLRVDWHTLLPNQGAEVAILLIHAYAKQGTRHAAIPDLPALLATRSIHEIGDAPSGWQAASATIKPNQLHPEAQWIRLEWRIVLPRSMRMKQRASILFFDDIRVTRVEQG